MATREQPMTVCPGCREAVPDAAYYRHQQECQKKLAAKRSSEKR